MANSQITKVAATPVCDLISTQTVSAVSNVDFTGLSSTYNYYLIVSDNMTFSTTGGTLGASLYNGSWISSAGYYRYLTATATGSGTMVAATASSTIGNVISNKRNANAGADYFEIKVRNFASTSKETELFCKYTASGSTSTTSDYFAYTYVVPESNTEAHTGVRLTPSTGTVSGTFKLYGYY